MTEQTGKQEKKTTIKVQFTRKPDFKGTVAAFAFDSAGNLLDRAEVKENKAVLALSAEQLSRGRLFFAPVAEDMGDFRPTLAMMQRLEAYEAGVRKKGKLIDTVRIPDNVIILWLICFCLVRGRVVKGGNGLPVCGAKVHICEVDKIWRWIIRLPDLEIFRLRDDLLREIEPPELRRPPLPDPPPVELSTFRILTRTLSIPGLNSSRQRPSLRLTWRLFREPSKYRFLPKRVPH